MGYAEEVYVCLGITLIGKYFLFARSVEKPRIDSGQLLYMSVQDDIRQQYLYILHCPVV